jgi:carboxyl-terminal processing protease
MKTNPPNPSYSPTFLPGSSEMDNPPTHASVPRMKLRLLTPLVVSTLIFCFPQGVRGEAAATSSASKKEDDAYSQIAVFARALQLIRQDYVDEKKVTYEQLTHAALRGMLESLDPHSQFMERDDFKDMQDDTNSRFGGLGVVVTERDGKLIIVSPMEDTPGFKAGLLPGDQLVKIDGQPTEKLSLNDAIEKLRGEPGQKVTLTIYRASTREYKDYEMVREVVKVPSVKDARMLTKEQGGDFKIGYARITQFNLPTNEELSRKLDDLEKQGMQGFILDLRYNPGGLLSSAVDVAGQFLEPGKLVASTEGRVPSQDKIYRVSSTMKARPRYPVALLINNGSASGSEIVAGALKDYNRAILVGETTFGKGSVQSVIQLQDGSAVRLTTAKYYTPSKNVIHEHGVTPTIRATMTSEQERQLMIQRQEDVLDDEKKQRLSGFQDVQLERAVDALKSVMVYADRTSGQKKPLPAAN